MRTFAFSEEQLDQLFSAICSTFKTNREWFRDYLIVYILYMTGLRANECLNLKLEDIDFKNKRIRIRAETNKVGEEQYIFMHDNVVYVLQYYISRYYHKFNNDYLFYTRGKKTQHLQRQHFGKKVREFYLKLAELDQTYYIDKQGHKRRRLRVHSLRKTFCTKLIIKNPDRHIAEIARVTRHKSLDVLNTYYLEINENKV